MRQYTLVIKQAAYWVSVGVIFMLLSLSVAWIISSVLSPDTPNILFGRFDLLSYLPYLLAALLVSVVGLTLTAGQPLNQMQLRWDFSLRMEDVAKAYYAVHHADRSGIFQLPEQFDAVRQRMQWLQSQPELSNYESDVLLLAAQMSETTKSLASRYNDDTVKRAEQFLVQREQECERFEALVVEARSAYTTVQTKARKLQLQHETTSSELNALHEDMRRQLEPLGFVIERKPATDVILLTDRVKP